MGGVRFLMSFLPLSVTWISLDLPYFLIMMSPLFLSESSRFEVVR